MPYHFIPNHHGSNAEAVIPGVYKNTITHDAKASDTIAREEKVLEVEASDTERNGDPGRPAGARAGGREPPAAGGCAAAAATSSK